MLGLDLSVEPRAIREAREEQTIALVNRQLTRRLGQELPEELRLRLSLLSLPLLEDLSEALLDFTALTQLQTWLNQPQQIIQQLGKKLGVLEAQTGDAIAALPAEQLKQLGEALLNFTSVSQLQEWLQARSPSQ